MKTTSGQQQIDSNLPLIGNWCLLNTDRAVKLDIGLTSVKGVLQDHNGEWILGFNHYLGMCSVLKAELLGIFDGLILFQRRGLDREANKVVDSLAKMPSDKKGSVQVLEEVLEELIALFESDIAS
ncbi:hypothetical protein Goklo_006691, partial [Gossypium klotzschianum]|nr:hypothetical protein [Gossypium klotzschianum]